MKDRDEITCEEGVDRQGRKYREYADSEGHTYREYVDDQGRAYREGVDDQSRKYREYTDYFGGTSRAYVDDKGREYWEIVDAALEDDLFDAPVSTRMSGQERFERRLRWSRQGEGRERFQAAIAEMEAAIAEREKAGDTDAQLEKFAAAWREDLGLWTPEGSPAMQFITQKLKGVPTGEVDDKVKLAVVELIKSDTPLDPRTRQLVAGDLYDLYFPNPQRDRVRKRQLENAHIEVTKRHLLRRGMPFAEVEREIAKVFNISVAALRKRVQPSRTKTRRKKT